jgi:PAS domain S-box-containing protein
MQDQHTDRDGRKTAGPIISRQPDWLEKTLQRIERVLPGFLQPRTRLLLSFKNRILIGTLFVLVGVVITIGIILQLTVFPHIEGDAKAVSNIKVIHLLVSLVMIGLSWLFIEFISKKITLPLLDLTKRADQISREAGAETDPADGSADGSSRVSLQDGFDNGARGDEIFQLTSAFNRMLFHLKASEARLRESEEKYRFLFDNGPFPIFVMDAEDMRILDVNARAVEEYQYTQDELLQLCFADLGLDRDREKTLNLLKSLFPTEVTLLPVLHHTRLDGSVFMVNFQARLTRFRDRPAIIAAVWDVTEKLEKHAMLIQASKMATLGEMATGIAHELNQPLNVIRLGCDYLVKRIKTGKVLSEADLSEVHAELASSVERAARIIKHLREFGRKPEDTMFPIDANAPIHNVFTLLGTQLTHKGIRWELDLDPLIPKILGDANRLEQVFINLVLNARDAILSVESRGEERDQVSLEMLPGHQPTHSGSFVVSRFHPEASSAKKITVKSFFCEGRVVVTVSDTGPGVLKELRSRVFEPFFTTKEPGKGTGLGLSISYGIVKEHQGTIEVNRGKNAGAVFKLTFPALKTETHHGENPVSG